LNGSDLDGRALNVNEARQKQTVDRAVADIVATAAVVHGRTAVGKPVVRMRSEWVAFQPLRSFGALLMSAFDCSSDCPNKMGLAIAQLTYPSAHSSVLPT